MYRYLQVFENKLFYDIFCGALKWQIKHLTNVIELMHLSAKQCQIHLSHLQVQASEGLRDRELSLSIGNEYKVQRI